VNFNVLLSKYIVHPLVKIKDFDNIKILMYLQNIGTCAFYIAVNAAHLSKQLDKLLKGPRDCVCFQGNQALLLSVKAKWIR